MKEDKVDRAFADLTTIDRALALAVNEALLQHKRANNAVAVWLGGRTVWLPPTELPIDPGLDKLEQTPEGGSRDESGR
ncbi:MAG: hypothetical protein M3498_08815 [Deinococcota bacterium]|jgi:hypothetical protein|nr:hypothetical protein [Deinococcota bacterium]